MKKTAVFTISITILFCVASSLAGEITMYDWWEGVSFTVKEPLQDIKKPDIHLPEQCKSSVKDNLNMLVPDLVQKPQIPLRTQDKIIRVLIFPYKISKSQLMGQQFVYLKVSEGDWILGTYLLEQEQRVPVGRTFKPLTSTEQKNDTRNDGK